MIAAFRPGEERAFTNFFSLVLTYNTGAAFSFLAGAAGLAALVLRRDRNRGSGADRLAPAARRRRNPLPGPGADPRRRARQSLGPADAGQGRRLPAVPLRWLGVPGLQCRRQLDHRRRGAADPRQLPEPAVDPAVCRKGRKRERDGRVARQSAGFLRRRRPRDRDRPAGAGAIRRADLRTPRSRPQQVRRRRPARPRARYSSTSSTKFPRAAPSCSPRMASRRPFARKPTRAGSPCSTPPVRS